VTRSLARLAPLLFALLLTALVMSACSGLIERAPSPTPEDFQGIAAEIVSRGIHIDHLVSGDAGCTDQTLTKTAIAFDANGLDQATVVRVRVYIFGDAEAYTRLRSTIDACAAAYLTDASTFESIDESPFVVTGQGPWGTKFAAALRKAIDVAAGTGY